jgi:thiopurine S-methyltransferase
MKSAFTEVRPTRCWSRISRNSLWRKAAGFLCPCAGKTLDISWLLSNGYRVAGAELSAIAIEQLFTELGAKPTITRNGGIDRYHAPDIDIFVGDIFDVTNTMLRTG